MKKTSSLSLLAFVLLLSAGLLWAWQSQLNAPSRAPQTAFSTEAAFATLARLLKEQVPHPTGSAANAMVRDRILQELRTAGYVPEVQSAFQCSPPDRNPGCTQVENIIAVYKGTGQGKAILATAHYDSVPAGPGVADDGVGVVVMLELAKHLKTLPTSRNDVIILITDGEETGLRGAVAFAERHSLMKNVGIVVNVESRGNTGPSVMFETGTGNAALMQLFADTVPSPVSNSLAYEIYRLLPNDTDFSIYKRYALTGFNFAMIGSASRYHTPRDNLALLDKNSLQHHGDHAFSLVTNLLDADLRSLEDPADASYFDVFGQRMLIWPASINFPVSLLSLLAVLGLGFVHRSELSVSKAAMSFFSITLVLGFSFGLGWLLSYPLGIWSQAHPLDHPEPWPARAALLASALFVGIATAMLAASRSSVATNAIVVWLFLCILAALCAFYLPGASYALVWPTAAFALSGWIAVALARTVDMKFPLAVGFVLIAFFWLSHMLALDAVIGFNASQFKLMALAPFALALVPLFAIAKKNIQALSVSAAMLFVATVLGSQAQGYSRDHPRPLNLIYYDNKDGGEAKWLVSELPGDDSFFGRAGFGAKDETFKLAGLAESRGRLRQATDVKLEAPTLSISEVSHGAGITRLSGNVQAARAGFVLAIGVPAGTGIKSVSVEGQLVIGPEKLKGKSTVSARLFGVGNKRLKVEFEFTSSETASIVLIERSALPNNAETAHLLSMRPENASPVHSGDGALVFKTVDLQTFKSGTASPPPP